MPAVFPIPDLDVVAETDLHAHEAESLATVHGGLVSRFDKRMTGVTAVFEAHGTSLTGADTSHVLDERVSERWVSKVAEHVQAKTERNYGVSGSKLLPNVPTAGWVKVLANQTRDLPNPTTVVNLQTRPPTGLYGMHWPVNDYGDYAGMTGFMSAIAETTEAVVRLFRAVYIWRVDNGRFNTTGSSGWTSSTSTSFGGAYLTRNSPGSANFVTPSDFPGGTLVGYISQNSFQGQKCVVRVYIDGVDTGVVLDTTNMGFAGADTSTLICVVVPNVPAGIGHIIKFDFTTMANAKFLGVSLTSAHPPMIGMVGQPYSWVQPPPEKPLMTNAIIDAGNNQHIAVANKFSDGRVFYVDVHGMDGNALYWQGTDHIHYSPEGHDFIADRFLEELAKAGGLSASFASGAVNNRTYAPDYSAVPGKQFHIDTTTGKLWTPTGVQTWQSYSPSFPGLDEFASVDAGANLDDILQYKDIGGGVVGITRRNMAQLLNDLGAVNTGTSFQQHDADLDTIAAQANAPFGLSLLTLADSVALLGALALSSGEAILASNTNLPSANTFVDLINTGALVAGTYFIIGVCQASDGTAQAQITAKLYDGASTIYAANEASVRSTASQQGAVTVWRRVVLASTKTITLAAASTLTSSQIRAQAPDNNPSATSTRLFWIRIA